MKLPKLLRRKKLRGTAARPSLRASAQTDYEEMSEPNMKLSRALLIVLVLHVVAVSGIIAFNAIKTRQGSIAAAPASTKNTAVAPKAFGVGSTIKPPAASSRPAAVQKDSVPVKQAAKEGGKTKQSENAKNADAGKVYVVAKGDNPVTIAKKFKVSYDDLIALNHIEDPRKLQIGQKLLIPKTTKSKKTDE
jgi:LysM repeat protein